jgi:hypothetical protein
MAAPSAARGVTPTEVACLVHAYLAGEGFHRAAEAFRADAAELLAPVHAVRRLLSALGALSAAKARAAWRMRLPGGAHATHAPLHRGAAVAFWARASGRNG